MQRRMEELEQKLQQRETHPPTPALALPLPPASAEQARFPAAAYAMHYNTALAMLAPFAPPPYRVP